MIVQCCVCRKIRQADLWVEPDARSTEGEDVSHGYCPECGTEALEEFDADRKSTESSLKDQNKITNSLCSSV